MAAITPRSLHNIHAPHRLEAMVFGGLAVIVVAAVFYAAAKARATRRRNIIEALVADAHNVLGPKVWKSRPAFGRAAAKWQGSRTLEMLHCHYGKGSRDTYVGTQKAMEDIFSHRLGYRATVAFNHPKHTFVVRRVPPIPPLPSRVDHPTKLDVDPKHPYLIPIGVTHGGGAVTLDLDGPDPHLLTVGKTRSGKSALLATVGVAACRRGIDVRVCDIKRVSLAALKDFPGVTAHAVQLSEIVKVITDVVAEMDRRYQAMDAGTRRLDLTPLLLIVDEAAQLSQIPGAERVGDALAALARQGGYARVHLALGFQQASAMFFGKAATEARGNYGVTVALGKMSTIAMGMVGIETPVPVHPRGRAVVATSDGEQVVQVYWTPSQGAQDLTPADTKLLRSLRPEAVPMTVDPQGTPIPAHVGVREPSRDAPDAPVTPVMSAPDAVPDPPRVGRKVTDEQREAMRRLSAEGVSNAEIGRRLGLSRPAVVEHLKRNLIAEAEQIIKDA